MNHLSNHNDIVHTDHNVYILGAGFSTRAGLPVVKGFLNCTRDSYQWLRDQNRNFEAEAIKSVLKYRLEAASASYWTNIELENIEQLFSLASARHGNKSDDIKVAIAATIDFALKKASNEDEEKIKYRIPCFRKDINKGSSDIPKWLENASWFKKNEDTNNNLVAYETNWYNYCVNKLLGMYDTQNMKGENTFITFNYDTLLEDALKAIGIKYANGIDEELEKDARIKVLKLHGSISWTKSKSHIVSHRDYDKVRANYDSNDEIKEMPAIIPPTWDKTFSGKMNKIWKDAVANLETATRIIIIGFSMPETDLHFKYLIAAGLQNNISLRKIFFVNLDDSNVRSHIEQRAKEIFYENILVEGKAEYIPKSVEQFLQDGIRMSAIGRERPPHMNYW